jgi:hypothetical protein
MIYKSLLAAFFCYIALIGFLLLSPFRPSVSAAPTNDSVVIDVDTSSFTGFIDVYTTNTRVLANGLVTVTLQADGLDDYNAASLRVYTENDPSDPNRVRRGMVGQDALTDTIPFKIWTPNFGSGVDNDGDGVPDVDNDWNWKHITRTVWAYVLDKNEPMTETWPVTSTESCWNRPLFNYTDLFKWSNDYTTQTLPFSLTLQQPVHFALALERKVHPQDYSTQVYFEFALSDDLGDTITTSYTATMTLTATLNYTSPTVNLSADTSEFAGFSNLDPWPQRVLASGGVTLTASAYGLYPYDAATIRVYTKNAQGHLGMVGDCNRDWTVPLKVWTPNFGDGDGIPDPGNDENWRDIWVYVFDWNHPVTETWWATLPITHSHSDPQCAWCHPLFNYTDLFKWSDYNDNKDANGDYAYHLLHYLELTDRRWPQQGEDRRVPLYFAADFTDALPQTYSTTLYIEFAFSSDKGDNIAKSVTETIVISATVPGDGSPINWLLNRVHMRPDMDSTNDTVEKLADSLQEARDESDGGWTYDQALMVIALTAAGHDEEAKQILNGLKCLQNDDGSWFFSYMTDVTGDKIEDWKNTDEVTLYDGNTCLTETIASANSYPDELEERACWDVTHGLPLDQIGPWILEDYGSTLSPQTQTLLSDTIKYRTYDFRKFAGTNAWVIMAINFYEAQTGDSSYQQMALKALDWLISYSDTVTTSPTYGGIAMGRVWDQAEVTATLTTTYGFVDRPVYVAEHNFDSHSAFLSMGRLTGNDTYTQTAEQIGAFLLRELWAPHVDKDKHPGLDIDNFFFPGIDMSDKDNFPNGVIDTSCIYLDGQTWSVLALGPETEVRDKDGMTKTLKIALDFPDKINPETGRPYMLVSDTTIFSGTCYMVTEIDGYKESTCSTDFVWSEGSEGMVAACYRAGDPENIAKADYYHDETASYMMGNGGVPYSTLPANPTDPSWNWTDANSIAGTAWFYFNERSLKVNPFQPQSPVRCIYFPIIMKRAS